MFSRNQFLKTTALATGSALFAPKQFLGAEPTRPTAKPPEIHIFSKHLQFLDYNALAQTIVDLGFDGADLTVRPKGHVLPEHVERDLPKVAKAMRKAGKPLRLMTTQITDPADPHTEKILKVAAGEGIRYYRMGWIAYDPQLSIMERLEALRPQMRELADMNKHYGITGDYQNHAGTKIGAAIWDIYHLIQGIAPEWLGCQFDVRHAVAEGGNSWPTELKLIHPYIHTLDIKDFVWAKEKERWRIKNVPLGEGMVNFEKYVSLLNELNVSAPFSLHYEYELGGAEKGSRTPTWKAERIYEVMRKDLAFFKEKLN